jgi:hypothetical protein
MAVAHIKVDTKRAYLFPPHFKVSSEQKQSLVLDIETTLMLGQNQACLMPVLPGPDYIKSTLNPRTVV